MPFPVSSTPFVGSNPSPAYSGTFIPEIWSGKLIERFYDATVLAAVTNTMYEGEIKNQGDKVIMRTRPIITIRPYQSHQDLLVDRPSSAVIEMDIDKGQYFNFQIDDVLKHQMDIDLMNQWSADASEQMKIAIDSDVLRGFVGNSAAANRGATAGRISANLNIGAAGAPVNLSKNNMIDYIVFLGQVLDEQNIPETGRWLILPAWAASLLKRSDLKDASLTGDSVSAARNGRLGIIDRFTIYVSNLLPTSTTDGVGGNDADGATYIYAGHKNAMTFASQLTEMEMIRSERAFGSFMRGLQVYGYKVIDPTAYAILYAKAAAGAFTPAA